MLYVLNYAGSRNGRIERYSKSNCYNRSVVPLPYPVPSKSISMVLARPSSDLPTSPFPSRGYGSFWNTDTRLARVIRVGGTPELPTLPEWKSNLRQSAPSKDWKERLAAGEIVVNPMMRSNLVIRDTYKLVPGSPSTGSNWAWVQNRIDEPVTVACFNRPMVSRGEWWYDAGYAGTLDLGTAPMASVAEIQWVSTDDPSAVAPVLQGNMTNGRAAHIHQLLVAALDALPYDGSLTTKVIADTRSGTYDLLTDVAEFKSTVQTLMSCVVRILRFYLDTKKKIVLLGRKPRGKKAIDEFTTKSNNQWLEFRYGISPIVLSANAAIEWLNTRNHEYAKFRGLNNHSAVITAGDLVVSFPSIIDRAFGKVRVDGATGGLKLNPLRTALELVPMSLLLNWVCNIGDVLSACYPASGAKQEAYSVSRQVVPGVYPATYQGEEILIEFSYYRNIVINPYDHIKLELGFNMNWQRFIDAFAFAYGPLKKKLLIKK